MMRKEGAGAPGTEFSLDASDCINLQQILQAFNSTISEEHAWALFYQAAKCFQKCLAEGSTSYLATEPRHLLLHKDGFVHPNTLLRPGVGLFPVESSTCGCERDHELPKLNW
ncbi:unnamed protein product, partial [Iphiclides podalirius]